MFQAALIAALIVAPASVARPDREVTVAGPHGPLAGSFREAQPNAPVVLIVPGSGPTDRDGNNPMGVNGAPYRMLAEGLATEGISTLRIDKRGLFGSKAAIADPAAVTIADYAADVHSWARAGRRLGRAKCIFVAGHSEGALVALAAAQNPRDICGVITLAGAGRPLDQVLRQQLKANPANAPILAEALADLDRLKSGGTVDENMMSQPLRPLFSASLQPYLRDLLSYDPAKLAARTRLPLLIVQGARDLQVGVADAQALKAARPSAKLVVIADANHVLKQAPADDRAANLATYSDPRKPLASGVVEAIRDFVIARGP
jgi:pimeloyl-ACP methyl ester carboxylesterase